MSGIIHFGSGKELEITELEFSRMGPKLNAKGIRTQVTMDGHMIPLNSSTMEYIEHIPEPEADKKDEVAAIIAQETVVVELKEEPSEPPKPKTQDELLAEMVEKSNCEHESEKLTMYIQHTAKGYRYFPVCSFCGKRERYVSEKKILDGAYKGTVNEKWTADDIANAKPWVEV
jgi:hypothetical protein